MPDQRLTCRDCGAQFPFTEGEQQFYALKNLLAPQRCKNCRQTRKDERGVPREWHEVTCDQCGLVFQAPLRPQPVPKKGKYVLCLECFLASRSTGTAPEEDECYIIDIETARLLREMTTDGEPPLGRRETGAHKKLDQIEAKYHGHREWTRERLRAVLTELSGGTFPTLLAKQNVVAKIRRQLRRMELRIRCPVCEEPAMLKAAAAGNSAEGLFQFDHSSGGSRSTHGGSSTFPADLQVVDAPADGRLKDPVSPTKAASKRA